MKKIKNVYQSLSALLWKEGSLYIAKAVEVEVASQGSTKKEALANLKEALELYFEDAPKLNIDSTYQDLSLETVSIHYA